ncbi:pirin family protein [Oceanisphaera sp. IT1-181]|uniref:pirin family protein n=1 Tax=Oceanisphaera sp. IT1-181 TaxID=3081199 RepID=UPI0029CA3653|nr:pirin family protein [Oceanisphaera sp. IT1-181]
MRELIQVIPARPTQDGDGVKIHRLAGQRLHQVLNPFLMIDEINSDNAADYIGGFPEHPHRGFETITYMKAGRMRHRDHMGNEGVISAGDVQWMTAGSGVLHSEMPEQEHGLLHGFQIWLNLPAAEKMKPAAYQEIVSADISEQRLSTGGMVRVIAGNVTINQHVQQGPLPEISTQPVFIDVQLTGNETVELSFNADNSVLVYVYKGATDLIGSRQLGIYAKGNTLHLQASSSGAEILVLSGRAIEEPVVQYGPFVMNTPDEIEQALHDFSNPQFLKQLTSGRKTGP